MEPTTGKATVAEEVPGAGAGDSMVAAVAELTNTAETKRATKKLLTFLISIIIIIIYLFLVMVLYVFLSDALKVKVKKVFIYKKMGKEK
ncbi:hypothetical protein Bca4012_066846 [Brassica carinata]